MNRLEIRQLAYFVPDVRLAALAHHRLHGSGPYFIADHIPLRRCVHRGVERPLDHSSAYGQWGDIMIEFVQQNGEGPSAFRGMFAQPGAQGLHHVALFVDDVDVAITDFAGAGHDLACRAEMNDGFVFAFVDTVAAQGHMTELYAPVPQLTDFYAMVARAAQDFDGTDPLRPIQFN
tara:strand:+ start:405 stop:932 length:528 start_codon:yes stop_codon:yes gene_type:complete